MPSVTQTRAEKTFGESLPAPIGGVLNLARFDPDPEHRQPNYLLVGVAVVVAAVVSLLADWGLAKAGVAVFPSTRGYQHFRFGDYSTLTLIGVAGAGIGWPIVTRLCHDPRWLYGRLAIIVTAVLLLPDFYIWLAQSQPFKAVFVLMLMHVAIGIITYFAMVLIAPHRRPLG